MSTSNPSVIFYQGMRCTKVPRSLIETSSTTSLPDTTAVIQTSVPAGLTTSETTDPSNPSGIPSADQLSNLTTADASTDLSSSDSLAAGTAIVTETSTATSITGGNSVYELSGHGTDTHNTLRTALGSVLGTLTFVALGLLIWFFLLRHRRRKSRGNRDSGGSEKLLRSGRESAGSSTSLHRGYLSGMSFFSDVSSTHSSHHLSPPLMSPADNGHNTQESAPLSNPFSDSAEISQEVRTDTHSVVDKMQDPQVSASHGGQPIMRQAFLPERAVFTGLQSAQHDPTITPGLQVNSNRGSMHGSERSFGSTIILPGRNSFGSSFRRTSYPISISDVATFGLGDSLNRVSARSDPFDLEVPPHALRRQSSGTLPVV